jgi:hypothetical protein
MGTDPIELLALARELRVRLPVIPSQMVQLLMEAGWVRYVAGGRGIGTAAPWTPESLDPEAATA